MNPGIRNCLNYEIVWAVVKNPGIQSKGDDFDDEDDTMMLYLAKQQELKKNDSNDDFSNLQEG